jgi:hypothetical protein
VPQPQVVLVTKVGLLGGRNLETLVLQRHSLQLLRHGLDELGQPEMPVAVIGALPDFRAVNVNHTMPFGPDEPDRHSDGVCVCVCAVDADHGGDNERTGPFAASGIKADLRAAVPVQRTEPLLSVNQPYTDRFGLVQHRPELTTLGCRQIDRLFLAVRVVGLIAAAITVTRPVDGVHFLEQPHVRNKAAAVMLLGTQLGPAPGANPAVLSRLHQLGQRLGAGRVSADNVSSMANGVALG